MRYTLLFLLLVLIACDPPELSVDGGEKFYNVRAFTRHLIQSDAMSSANYVKYAEIDGESEVKEFEKPDSVFWKKELAAFLNLDMDRPSLKNVFKIQLGSNDDGSNLLVDRYELKAESDAEIKFLEVAYLEDSSNVRWIILIQESTNPLFYSRKENELFLSRYNGALQPDSVKSRVEQWRYGTDTMHIDTQLYRNN